jgi:hypothetical protein
MLSKEQDGLLERHPSPQEREIALLRRELERVKQENDTLKKVLRAVTKSNNIKTYITPH